MGSGDGRDTGGGPTKTTDGNAAGPAPTPEPAARPPVRNGDQTQPPDDVALGGAQTAVATQSERMATLPRAGASTDERERLVGQVLAGRYEITKQIGAGGMGAVFEATHKLIGKRVAVKVLLDKYAEKDQVIARLEQEARLASSIGHPNIIDITDFGETEDRRRFVVMEYLEGESLGARLQRLGALPMHRIVRICAQIASALAAAHKKGVVHRDIKPENVFLISRSDDDDFVKVVDFGISKAVRSGEDDDDHSPRLTQTGMVLGTPLYMSPEQARGDEQLDHRIDIYAVGVIMYELATGEVPFRGSNYLNIISQVLSADAKPPRQMRPDLDISEDFEAVVLKALAKDRDQRYQSMEELTNDLKALAGGGMVGATSGSFWAMKKRGARGRSPLRALGWVAAVAVVIAAMAFTINTVMSGEEAVDGAAGPAAIDAGPAVARVTIDAGPLDPGVEVVDIELVSTPPGATVWADGGQRLICEPTPCKWPAVKKDRAVRLIFELDGYDDAEIEINPLTSGPSQKVRLNKIKKGRKKKSLRKNTGTTKPPSGEDDTVSGELMGNPIKKKKQQKGD